MARNCYTVCWMAYRSKSLLLREYGMEGLVFVSSQENFFLGVQPAPSPIQLPINWVPEILIRDMRPGRHVDLSFSSSAEVKNEWSCTSSPPVCLYVMYGYNLTLYTQEVSMERFCNFLLLLIQRDDAF